MISMNNIIKKLHEFIYLLFAVFILLYLFYRRFFKIHTEVFLTNIDSANKFIYIFFFLVSFLLIINIVKSIYYKTTFNNNVFSNLIKKHYYFYENALYKIHIIIQNLIKKKYNIRKFLSIYILPLIKNESFFFHYYIIVYCLPKTIIIITFFIDIIYFKSFYYFYFMLSLLLICLLSDYFLYVLKNEYVLLKNEIEPLIDIKLKSSNLNVQKINNEFIMTLPENIVLDTYISTIIKKSKIIDDYYLLLSINYLSKVENPRIIDFDKNKLKLQKFLNFIIDLKIFIENFNKQKSQWYFKYMLFSACCYLLGWSVILSYNYPLFCVEDLLKFLDIINKSCNINEPFADLPLNTKTF